MKLLRRYFCLINIGGLFTLDLVSMSWYHVFELTLFSFLIMNDLCYPFFRQGCWEEVMHHLLALIGISLQFHIGVGGGLMSYLFLDQIVVYFEDTGFYWPVFFGLRIVGYNVILAIAVKQGIPRVSSRGEHLWLLAVRCWWGFSIVYHIVWIWRCREEITALYFRRGEYRTVNGSSESDSIKVAWLPTNS
jgi:hypothetical protein